MKNLLFVVNPNAGTRQARRFLPDLISDFNRAGYLCRVYLTEKRGDAADVVRAFAPESDLVVACGGDGTLNETVTGLLSGGHKVPLGYLPAGSTNDFANGLGIPADLRKACERIIEGRPKPIDMGIFGADRYFCYTASFGAFTSVSWSTPQNVKNVLGHAAYVLQGIRSLADIRPIRMSVTADGQVYENDYIFGAVCNSTSLGGVLKLDNGKVHMSDGLFEALFIPYPADILALNRIISSLSSHHYEDPSLIFVRAASFTFAGAPDLVWTLDGEVAAGAGTLDIRNLHQAVRLVC